MASHSQPTKGDGRPFKEELLPAGYAADEKIGNSAHIEDNAEFRSDDLSSSLTLTPEQQRKIMFVPPCEVKTTSGANDVARRKIDLRLFPILGIMYSISLVDRTNLGLALVAGLQEDLGLNIGNRYTIIVMVFFISYMCVMLFFCRVALELMLSVKTVSSKFPA